MVGEGKSRSSLKRHGEGGAVIRKSVLSWSSEESELEPETHEESCRLCLRAKMELGVNSGSRQGLFQMSMGSGLTPTLPLISLVTSIEQVVTPSWAF